VADVVVRIAAAGGASLPAVRVGCGRPRGLRRVRVAGDPSGYGLMAGEQALDNLERIARGPGVMCVPVCWRHRWVVPPAVTATAAGDAVRLTGGSEPFAAAIGGSRRPV
jgi:hypothetical protein